MKYVVQNWFEGFLTKNVNDKDAKRLEHPLAVKTDEINLAEENDIWRLMRFKMSSVTCHMDVL